METRKAAPAERSPKHGLTRHPRGAWYKSVSGVWTCVAGKREAPTGEDADRVYERRFRELWGEGGVREPAPTGAADVAAISDLFDLFIDNRRQAVAAGKLDQRTLDEYVTATQQFCDVVGADTAYNDLRPIDFTQVHQDWSKRYGPHRLSKFVSNVRTAFNWLGPPPNGHGFISRLPSYGDFRQATRADFRRHKAKREDEGAEKPFTPKEIAALLGHADDQQRAQILLALNGGFGNSDLSKLRERVIDLDKGWIDYRRGKTGVKRRCPLWPETIAAVRTTLPLSKITGNVFSTSDGRPLVHGTHDRLAARFKTLCTAANCYREDRGFYALRHTFSTEAMKHGAATMLVKRITGHTSGEEDRVLDEHYVGQVDATLCDIVETVRQAVLSEWSGALLATPLLAAPPKPKARQQGKPRSRDAGKRTPGRTGGRRASSSRAGGKGSAR